MKTILYIVLIIPVFCLAQKENSTPPKPATDDCPSWNKKSKSSSKAEYFQFLRSGKSKNQQQTAIYYPNTQRVNPEAQVQKQRTTEQTSIFIPRKERRTLQTFPVKENRAIPLKKGKIEEPKPQEKIIPKEEEPIVASSNNDEGRNAEKTIKVKETSTDPKTIIKDKPKTQSWFKRRLDHASTKKTKACKSGDASKCPSF